MYEQGRGVAQDDAEAACWYGRSVAPSRGAGQPQRSPPCPRHRQAMPSASGRASAPGQPRPNTRSRAPRPGRKRPSGRVLLHRHNTTAACDCAPGLSGRRPQPARHGLLWGCVKPGLTDHGRRREALDLPPRRVEARHHRPCWQRASCRHHFPLRKGRGRRADHRRAAGYARREPGRAGGSAVPLLTCRDATGIR
jgi:hypothetical protein